MLPIYGEHKGKNILPMRSIFFPLVVAFLKGGFLYIDTYSTIQKLIFDDPDSNILRMCVQVLLIV